MIRRHNGRSHTSPWFFTAVITKRRGHPIKPLSFLGTGSLYSLGDSTNLSPVPIRHAPLVHWRLGQLDQQLHPNSSILITFIGSLNMISAFDSPLPSTS
ncbi:hypothetical protein CDAR_497751 [Caerostris darwini]|uniref:Uncharacterized protein n=1 Tax=Caerostris darwini TaxID=1538125 RepID=A0AAV4PNZ6_9ARAC|nr:hypothetical protein CDAR_497751 [Caerostris darwini]